MSTLRPNVLAVLLALPLFLAGSGARSSSRDDAKRALVVDEILIDKSDHRLELRAGGHEVKTYRVAIGSGGTGPKRMEGDNVTPVGTYHVTGRIKGLFHNFLVVSYPNDEDRARYAELKRRGEVPEGHGVGNGIGIHGTGHKDWNGVHKEHDWTFGCVALDDDEIDEVAALVKNGTRIVITD
jgi:murein L,D-transpeptidase YafK